jgi:hypothetical protein
MSMIVTEDLALGLLLGVSLFLLAFFALSYRLSGVGALRPTIAGLVLHNALTFFLLLAVSGTDWFTALDWWVVPLADALVLILVLSLGVLGGRAVERSS